MIIDTLKLLFDRDLNRLKKEIELYHHESNLWKVEKSIANSAGNLCLHLIGNLNNFIGKEIGKTNYVRNRELEFSLKNVSRAQLTMMLDETMETINTSLDQLDEASLKGEYPIVVFDKKTTTEYMLIHLTTHLSYHLGQVNYHRRLIDN
ncbi:MAG: DinB superfamily protein [Chitinophagaceae bacterium]|nr:DinB superfamily protein [Chitinophagaceae bacterium]